MAQNQGKQQLSSKNQSQNSSNASTQLPKGYNNLHTVTTASGNNQVKVKIPNLYFHFFFDGTSNNKHNTRVRLDRLKEQEPTLTENSTILIDTKDKCDEFAKQDTYKNFNINFKDLYEKSTKYHKDIQELDQYKDVLSPKEKALGNIDRPEKPKITNCDYVDKPNMYKYANDISPYNEVDRDLALNKEKYLNKYDDLSYYNYYSNIALLSDAINIPELKNHYVFYIGGAGTLSFGKDDVSGAAYAHGESGVDDRVYQAIAKFKNLLNELKLDAREDSDDLNSNVDQYASSDFNSKVAQDDLGKIRININLYGFSRGSFYARYFYSQLKKLINSNDPDLQLYKYRFNFNLGIFLDTVTSEGLVHSNDVGEFDLDQAYDNMQIYHICAQDEFRYHFPLTSIPKCLKHNTKGIEIIIPGAHSDIGGGYSEVYDEIDQDLGYATLADNCSQNFEYVPFYWFLNKGFYYLNEEGRFFDKNSTPIVNGALTIRNRKVRCIKRRVYYPYQFVTAKIMQKIMIDNFGQKILDPKSEFCQQINNLKNWEIDQDGEHLDGIFTLSDYADRIIQWLNFRDNEKKEISNAQFQGSNIFDPTKVEPNISEATMKYIYNNYIHYSLVNSADLNKSEVGNMEQSQKNGFYIAYHANLRNTEPIKNDLNNDFDLIELMPYVDQSKITSKESEMSKYALEVEKKKSEKIDQFDRFMLGADYNKFINLEYAQGSTTPIYGYLQEKFNTTSNTQNYNNTAQLYSFDQGVIRFCPIERVEIIRDRPFLLDSKWTYIFHRTLSQEE